MLRATVLAALLLAAGASAYAGEEPTDHPTQTEKRVGPAAPTELVIVACRVVDWTGLRPLPEGVQAVHNWRDLEWFTNDGQEYECKREVAALQDSTLFSEKATGKEIPLNANFSDLGQCASRSMEVGPRWNDKHPGWAVMGVGCPVPIMNDNGTPETTLDDYVIGYKLPECPIHQPGTENRMRCHFDESVI
jgi:hypothetical protein